MYLAGRGKAVDHRQLTTHVGSSLGSWTVGCAQWFLNIGRGLWCSVLWIYYFFFLFFFLIRTFPAASVFEKANPKQPSQNKNKQTKNTLNPNCLSMAGWAEIYSESRTVPLHVHDPCDVKDLTESFIIIFLLFIKFFFLCFTQSKCWGSPKSSSFNK